MNSYLSLIAERNTQIENIPLSPVSGKPMPIIDSSDIGENEISRETEFIKHKPDPFQAIENPSKSLSNSEDDIKSTSTNNEKNSFSEIGNPENNYHSLQPNKPSIGNLSKTRSNGDGRSEIVYFSKHVERQSNFKTKTPINIGPENKETEYESRVKLLEDSSTSVSMDKNPDYSEPSKILVPKKEGKGQVMSSEITSKPEFIDPNSNQQHRADTLIPKRVKRENILPNLKDKEPLQNKKNTSGPTLIIGKITVEVISPANKVSPKIITKVVSDPSNQGQSKSNKLIFGLGQM